jgi:hypothetical protein
MIELKPPSPTTLAPRSLARSTAVCTSATAALPERARSWALERLSASRFSLTRPQRYFIADQLRDTADQIDGGEATSSAGSGASANGACAASRCTN